MIWRFKMKEVQSLLKLVSDGLKTLAEGAEAIAEKIDEIAEAQDVEKPKGKRPVKRAPRKKEAKSMTAADTVLKVISRSKKGVSTSKIMEKTGFTRKQVYNIVFSLKKQGIIKNVGRGVYVKS
jgi:predicted Rossmann fold nucleotide-binding protein DprA/Smf involved in DNA uptake